MSWDVTSFADGSLLPAAKLRLVKQNFETGSYELMNVSSGIQTTEVGSFGSMNVSSGFQTTEIGSFGALDASSGMRTTGVGSFGGMNVSSAITIAGAAPSPPATDTLYKDNIPKGWVSLDGTGVIAILRSYNVSGIVDDGVGLYEVTWDRDMPNDNYSIDGIACLLGSTGAIRLRTVITPPVTHVDILTVVVTTGVATDFDYITVHAFAN